jgi:hypothetical protein
MHLAEGLKIACWSIPFKQLIRLLIEAGSAPIALLANPAILRSGNAIKPPDLHGLDFPLSDEEIDIAQAYLKPFRKLIRPVVVAIFHHSSISLQSR